MPKNLLTILFMFWTIFVQAQTNETFSDGDFSNAPSWLGTDSLFRINTNLQLQSAGKSSLTPAFLALPFVAQDSLEWDFWLRIAFNPSSQNQARYYLFADSIGLNQSKNAVYIQFGGSTGNTDSISLYALNNGIPIPIIRGRPATLGATNNLVQIKVKLYQQKHWQLFSDTSINKQSEILEGKATFALPLNAGFQGIWFRYSIGNATNLYFDDFYFGPERVDTSAPALVSSNLLSDSSLELYFSDPPEMGKAEFLLNQKPISNFLVQTEKLTLYFFEKLGSKQTYILGIKNICDKQQNCQKDTSIILLYVEPKPHEVLITELLPDPSPSVGLPDAEFIEIYNNSDVPIPLKNLILADESKTYPFPLTQKVLLPQEFLILFNPKDSVLFSGFIQKLAMSLPVLGNEGKALFLLNQKLDTVHSYTYNLSSYKDPQKSQGGYSLEMIHPSRLCQKELNWQASLNPSGGTPGTQNSAWQLGPDTLSPTLLSASFSGLNQLFLKFNETIYSNAIEPITCTLNNIECLVDTQGTNDLLLISKDSLQHKKSFKLICSGIKDCSLNESIVDTNLVFYEQREPKFLEVLINEICFDESKPTYFPPTDFIELHNKSNYAINLQNLSIATNRLDVPLAPVLLYPDSYIILCKSDFANEFSKYGNTLGLYNFPSLTFNETLTLSNAQGKIIHQVSYKSDWLNNQLYLNPLAASLELSPTNNPCLKEEIWQASLSKKGSTPGRKNSVLKKVVDLTVPHLKMSCLKDSLVLLTFSEDIDSAQIDIRWKNGSYPISPSYFEKNLQKLSVDARNLNLPQDLQIWAAQDCAGNKMPPAQINIESSVFAQPSDILFTEVLFDSYPNQTDFVELHNTNVKPVSLDNLILIRKSVDEADWKEVISLNGPGNCLAPGKTIALHENPMELSKNYSANFLPAILQHPMLSLTDEGGIIELRDSNNLCIDSLYFSNDLHFELLVQTEGISLERLHLFPLDKGNSNWFSSAQMATPGLYFEKANPLLKAAFTATPQVFSPNLDGYKDFVTFNLNNIKETAWARLNILNHEGQLVYESEPNLIGQNHASLRWTGLNRFGQLSEAGIYFAVLEMQDKNGHRDIYRCSFAIAASKN